MYPWLEINRYKTKKTNKPKCYFYLKEVFPAICVFDEALHQLHEVCFWGFDYRIICLGCKFQHKCHSQSSSYLFAFFVTTVTIIRKFTSHLLDAWSSNSVQVSLNCFEIFRVFWTQKFKSCLKEIWIFLFNLGGRVYYLKTCSHTWRLMTFTYPSPQPQW